MSTYRKLHGINPAAPVLLPAIGASESLFARFRDVFASREGSRIHVLTQTGGAQRSLHSSNWDVIRSMRQYESDRDDTFYPTYAWITFKPLDEAHRIVRAFAPDEEPVLDLKVLTDRVVSAIRVREAHRDRRDLGWTFIPALGPGNGIIGL